MIQIHGSCPASLQLYLNNELFLDQVLPWSHTLLTPTTSDPVKKIVVKNTGKVPFTANTLTVNPGGTEVLAE
jgi:hypothetical protein|tara:strand:+ start:925 stop:1140 length:216 start_codon:yes stop_codon:yes gene_type:complete